MGFKYRILVVDDEPLIRQTSAMVLASNGYEVRTAGDGFEALIELRQALPDLIISDLSMPNMSGFELLSVVRRRFPEIPVIAITGKFDGTMPVGLIADSYFSKSHYTPEELFESIARLIEHGPIRPHVEKADKAPVWIPRNASGYVVITCTECLRSFSVPDTEVSKQRAFSLRAPNASLTAFTFATSAGAFTSMVGNGLTCCCSAMAQSELAHNTTRQIIVMWDILFTSTLSDLPTRAVGDKAYHTLPGGMLMECPAPGRQEV
jgi:CheY-like chemotaxis protein